MNRSTAFIALIAAGAFAGCRSDSAGGPPTIRYGEETCGSCRMIIGDERFAAALVDAAGEAVAFDDVGCLIEHEKGRLRPDVAYWARDFGGGGWLDAREAEFVRSPNTISPMGFNLAARPAGRPNEGADARATRFHDLPALLAAPRDTPEADGPQGGPRAGAQIHKNFNTLSH